ncbi:conserved membrane hypothetical protein [Candidatus Desulfosporosinus infrequens]|uniref:TrbL/VirB6 plasmid conjugal transfer family protein n=1 Tax=Candidatus Desulfosporosinus infrequens TaxID=2043169 RepID=A0A2U3KV88_9FIRM|nr:conserved membrane hypothetical protein [Candidatus Desulfosporosinus infrequens]
MKRVGVLILTMILFLNFLGGSVWAATPSISGGSTVSSTTDDGNSGGLSVDDIPILGQILSGVKTVKASVTSVVDFFQNFDPGELVNDWIKKSLSDFISPILAWAEQNTAQYPYMISSDPQFSWWEILVVLALALMLYAMLRIAGQIMKGQRTPEDIVVLFGLLIWLFSSIWVTNLMVYARNHITYAFLHWMIQENWLASDPLQSTAQFLVPDLAKAIMANQSVASAIVAFIIGGLIMIFFELVQMIVYGVWVLLVVGSPIFVTMTTLASDFTPFVSYINGLVRTLIATIVIALSWGLQGYVYSSQTDTVLQIIYQAVVVIMTITILWLFWGKFILTEILEMLSRPVQTVKGNVTSSAGSSLQMGGKAASVLGALTGNSRLSTMGYKAQTAGDVLSDHGEEIKVQASRNPSRHNDVFSRMVEKSFGREQAAVNERPNAGYLGVKGFKTSFKGPFTKPPSMNDNSIADTLDAHLDKAEQRMISEESHSHFQQVSTPGGGTFFKYDGPMADELKEQLEEKGVTVHTFDKKLAVDIVDEKIAKYLVTQNLHGKTPYWENNEKTVTVDPYGITHQHTLPPKNGLNMGPWIPKKKKKTKKKKDQQDNPTKDSDVKE